MGWPAFLVLAAAILEIAANGVYVMNRIAYVSVVVFMSLQGMAFSQDGPPKDKTKTPEQIQAVLQKETEKLTERYQQKISQVDSIYAQQLKAIKDKAVKELGELQKKVASKDLDEAIRIREMAKSVHAEPAASVDPSASKLKDLQGKLKRLEAENKDLKKESAANESAASILTHTKDEVQFVKGKTYKIPASKHKLWQFGVDGSLTLDGVQCGNWAVLGPQTVVTLIHDGNHVDFLKLSENSSVARMSYVGSGDKSRKFAKGTLVK